MERGLIVAVMMILLLVDIDMLTCFRQQQQQQQVSSWRSPSLQLLLRVMKDPMQQQQENNQSHILYSSINTVEDTYIQTTPKTVAPTIDFSDSANVSSEIQTMLNKRKVEDLRRFLTQSESLTMTNYSLTYMFITLYGIGLFIGAYATSMNDKTMHWIGLAINIFAQIIYATEKVNNAVLKQLQNEIGAIKDGTFVEQGATAGIDTVRSVQAAGFTLSSVAELPHSDTSSATVADAKSNL